MVKFCDECGKIILPSQINKETQQIQCACGNRIPVSAQEYFESKNQSTQVLEKDIKEIINQKLPIHCPNCSNELLLIDRNQEFLIQCSSFPDCDYLAKIPNPNELVCPNCERKLAFFNLQRNLVLGCSGYPICKFIIQTYLSDKKIPPSKPSSTTNLKSINKFQTEVIKIPEKCPKCESTFQLRQGPYGTFLGCRRYPSCKYTFNIQDPDKIYCPLCESIMVKRTGKYGLFLGCANYPQCRYTIHIKSKSNKKEIKKLEGNSEIKVLSNNLITSYLSFDWFNQAELFHKLDIHDKIDTTYLMNKLRYLEGKQIIEKKKNESQIFWRLTPKSIN
ncbi:MAG: topoisomerase DNA-binding C4 zinc finger domain-containing protein [Promethearchaeota archaeon]